MISLDQENRLGRKAYMLMVSRKTTAGLVALLFAVLLLALKSGLSGLIAATLFASGMAKAAALAASTNIVMMASAGLAILGLIMCAIGIIVARMEYGNLTFTFEEFGLKLKRGLLSTAEVTIPYRQMQDIDVERSLMHRLSGTSRVIINSAGHEEKDEKNETDIVLDPIDAALAEEIRSMMQRKIGVQVVEGEREADREAVAARAENAPQA